jgi:eukaryotic-like serine/threonine-protein kinase
MHRLFQQTMVLIVSTVYLSGFMTESCIAAGLNDNSNSQENVILWNFKTNGVIYGTPLLDNGVVYIGSLDSCFYAIDAASGIKKWQYKSSDQIFSTPIKKDSILCFESGNVLYGLNLQGNVSWEFKMYDSTILNKHDEWDYYHSSPFLFGNIVYIGTEKGLVFGIDVRNGTKVFQCQTPTADHTIKTTPAIYDDKIYVGDWNGIFYAFDLTNGNLVWQYNSKADNAYSNWVNAIVTDPVVYLGYVYFGGRNCNLYCLDAKTGAKKWMYHDPADMWIVGGPTFTDSTLYVGSSYQHVVRAFDALTGAKIFEKNVQYRVNGKPMADSDLVYIGTEHDTDVNIGTLCALNKTDGALKAKLVMGTQIYSTPVLSDGVIFFGGSNGYVYAVNQQGFLNIPYPKLQLTCPDTLDFGSFPEGTVETSSKLYIYNLGNAPDSVTVASGSRYIKIQPSNVIIAAHDSQEVKITISLSGLSVNSYKSYISFTSQKALIPIKTSKITMFRIQAGTGVETESAVPSTFSLSQNYPNPFNPSTVIQYQLPVASYVSLRIFNIIGQEVATLVNGYKNEGKHSQVFNSSSGIPSGVYFYRICAGEFQATQKMIVTK